MGLSDLDVCDGGGRLSHVLWRLVVRGIERAIGAAWWGTRSPGSRGALEARGHSDSYGRERTMTATVSLPRPVHRTYRQSTGVDGMRGVGLGRAREVRGAGGANIALA